jgi:hypothetical protein
VKLTRRQLVATLAPAAALAQTAASPQTAPASPADELSAAQARLKANSEALARLQVPMETEPAFQFKA